MIKSICILGGGTAGFMTAAILSKLNLKVKCIYSSDIGIIGVGESTQTRINDVFNFLGLKDEEWMPKCNATYKTNIGFESWSTPGEQFFFPFEPINGKNINEFFELISLFPDEVNSLQFSRYACYSSRFAELNKLSRDGWDFDRNTAYHFDTHLLSKLLYEISQTNGVEFVDDTYISSVQNEDGIEYLTCKDSGNHYADLFVDCSGFKSLLLGEELNVPFVSYADTLINNRVITAKIPYQNKNKQLKNYTNNISMRNGWCWENHLWDGISVGYVHTLKFSSKEEIEKEFVDRYGVKSTRVIDFKSGRRESGWVKNVASVGLAYGFIEPLESTGLVSVITNIFRLLEVITKTKNINSFDRTMFNVAVNDELDTQRGFIDMHYALSHRSDTEYWKYVIQKIKYNWNEKNAVYCLNMSIFERDYSKLQYGGLPFILAGNGYSPYSPGFITSMKYAYNLEYYEIMKNEWLKDDLELSNKFFQYDTSYEFTKKEIYDKYNKVIKY